MEYQIKKTTKAFSVHTRRGKLLRVSKEQYLRTDLGCGTTCYNSPFHGIAQQIEAMPTPENHEYSSYIVLDTNVALQQMDLLELNVPPLSRIIILETVFDELKNLNSTTFSRLETLLKANEKQIIFFSNEHHQNTFIHRNDGESPNDRNDRAIRVAVKWFMNTYGHQADFVFLSNDRLCREEALKLNIPSISIHQYTNKFSKEYPEMLEMLAHTEGLMDREEEGSGGGAGDQNGENMLYPAYKSLSDIEKGVKLGTYYKGKIRVDKNFPLEANIALRSSKLGFYAKINGFISRNRAVDGDLVAVRILTKEEQEQNNMKEKRWMMDNPKATQFKMWDQYGDDNDITNDIDSNEILEKEEDDNNNNNNIEKKNQTNNDQMGAMTSSNVSTNDNKEETIYVEVVGIIRRNLRPFCGSILPSSLNDPKGRSLFVPVDARIPRIYLYSKQTKNLIGKRILVALDGWGINSMYPVGHYLKTIGEIGDRETETQVVLLEHEIPTAAFSKNVMNCLPPKDWKVTEENMKGRMDLRHLNVCSIDPPGCKDIDDALHYRLLPNGNCEVGVHIADVTNFVKPGTAIDLEAASRSTSTYLVDRRLDMLPGLLTTTLCSLVSGVDRFSFSVIWEMTLDGAIVNTKFGKSVIHSKASLTYGQAQVMLDDLTISNPIAESVRALNKIAKFQRKIRMDKGALTLASPEVRFNLDSVTQDPTDVKLYELKDTNALVEEFMLLANVSVASKIVQAYPRFAVLRRHPEPNVKNFINLVQAASLVDIDIKVNTSKALAESLDNAILPEKPFFNKLIRIMTTRCMSQAVYFSSGEYSTKEFKHYGLAAELYTHFTSPIRRYADVLVHRLLAASIGIEALPTAYESRSHVRKLCDNMNKRHHMAQLAGRSSVALHTIIYFNDRPTITNASILKVRETSIVVLVPKYGIEGVIDIVEDEKKNKKKKKKKSNNSISNIGKYTYDEQKMALINQVDSNKSLCIFDEINIKISVIDNGFCQQELQLEIVWDTGINTAIMEVEKGDDNGIISRTSSTNGQKRNGISKKRSTFTDNNNGGRASKKQK